MAWIKRCGEWVQYSRVYFHTRGRVTYQVRHTFVGKVVQMGKRDRVTQDCQFIIKLPNGIRDIIMNSDVELVGPTYFEPMFFSTAA